MERFYYEVVYADAVEENYFFVYFEQQLKCWAKYPVLYISVCWPM